jgi:hypothetical protein
MRILHALTRYGGLGEGDVKRLTDREGLYRLRVGKWRIFFDLDSPDSVRIHGIDNRGEAYWANQNGTSSSYACGAPASHGSVWHSSPTGSAGGAGGRCNDTSPSTFAESPEVQVPYRDGNSR